MNQLIRGYWVTQAIYVVAELGIADLLEDGPKAPARTGRNHRSEHRALVPRAACPGQPGHLLRRRGRTVPADTARGHLAKRAWRSARVRTTARGRPLPIVGEATGGRSVGTDRIRRSVWDAGLRLHVTTPRPRRHLRQGHDGTPRRRNRTNARRVRLLLVRGDRRHRWRQRLCPHRHVEAPPAAEGRVVRPADSRGPRPHGD